MCHNNVTEATAWSILPLALFLIVIIYVQYRPIMSTRIGYHFNNPPMQCDPKAAKQLILGWKLTYNGLLQPWTSNLLKKRFYMSCGFPIKYQHNLLGLSVGILSCQSNVDVSNCQTPPTFFGSNCPTLFPPCPILFYSWRHKVTSPKRYYNYNLRMLAYLICPNSKFRQQLSDTTNFLCQQFSNLFSLSSTPFLQMASYNMWTTILIFQKIWWL